MHRFLLLFMAVFFYCARAGAQTEYADTVTTEAYRPSGVDNDEPDEQQLTVDTTLSFRAFTLNTDSLNKWKTGKDYAWIKTLDSTLRHLKEQDDSKKIRMENHGAAFWDNVFSSGILSIIFWTLAGGMVLFIIYRLFLSKGIFGVAAKKTGTAVKENEDIGNDIDGKDFAQLLNKAYAAGDYRTATRWIFLVTLQKLNEREMIRFGADKTNTAYLNEMPQGKRNDFASLSLYYEYIWYGKAPLQKETFDMIRVKYNDFLNRL